MTINSLATLLIRLFGFWMILGHVLDFLCVAAFDPYSLLRPESYAVAAVYVVLGCALIATSRLFAALLCRGLDGAGLK